MEVDVTRELEEVKNLALTMERLRRWHNPLWRQIAQRLVDACLAVARVVYVLDPGPPPRENAVAERNAPPSLAERIAELAAAGRGVREIARALGVNASTVSRRLRALRNGGVTPPK